MASIALLGLSCGPDTTPFYYLFVTNNGVEDRMIVLGQGANGSSAAPALLVPADGVTRDAFGATTGSPGEAADVTVYDLNCRLLDTIVVHEGSWHLIFDETGTATLHRQPPQADQATLPPLADYASAQCLDETGIPQT